MTSTIGRPVCKQAGVSLSWRIATARTEYTLAAYELLAYSPIRVERHALDGSRNTVLPVSRREDLLVDERAVIVTMLASDPDCGEVMQGTGGVRKVRVAVGGRGKSGGARVTTTSTAATRCRS
jgi:hypothetical protein